MFLPLLALVFLAVLAALYLPLKRLYLAHPVSWRRPSALNSSVLPTTQDAHTTALHPLPPPPSLRGRGRGRARSKGRLFGLGDRLGFNFGARRAKSLGPVLPRFNPATTPYAARGRGGHAGYNPLASAPASPSPTPASSPYVAEFASGGTDAVPLVDLSTSWGTISSISHSSAGSASTSKHPEMLVDVSHANEAEYELIDVSVPPSPAAWARAHPPLKPTPTSSFPTSPAAGAASFPIAFVSSTSSSVAAPSSVQSIEAMNAIQKTPSSSSSSFAPSHTTTSLPPPLKEELSEVSLSETEGRMEIDVPAPDPERERQLQLETHLPSPPLSPALPTARPAFFTFAQEEAGAGVEAPLLLPVVRAQAEVEAEPWVQEDEVQRQVVNMWVREELDEGVWEREVQDETVVARDPFVDVDVEEQEQEPQIETKLVPSQPSLLLPLADADADAAPDPFPDPFQEVAYLQTRYEDEEELLVEVEDAVQSEDVEHDHDDVTYPLPPVPALLHIDLPPPRAFSSFPVHTVEAEDEDKDELEQEEAQMDSELELESELPSAHAIDVLVAGVRAMEAQAEEAAPAYDEAPAYSPAAVSVPAPAAPSPTAARLFARTPEEEESADFEHEEDSFDGMYPGTAEGEGQDEVELGPLPAHLAALPSLPRVEPEHDEQRAELVRWLDALPALAARTTVADVLVAQVATRAAQGEEDVLAAEEKAAVQEEEQDEEEVGAQEDPAELALPSLPLPSTPLPIQPSLPDDDETDSEVEDPEELTLPPLPLPLRKTLAEEYPVPPVGDIDVEELVLDKPASDEVDGHADAEELGVKALHVDTAHLPAAADADDDMREQDLASAVSSSSASPSSAVVLLHSKSTSDWDLEDEDTSDPEAEEDLGTSRALTVVPRTIPAWSRRAAAAPALGLPSSTLALHQRERELAALGLGEERVPGAFPGSASASVTSFQLDKDTLASAGLDEKPKSTATSSAVERSGSNNVKPRRSPLDAALAMQLRPGLGLGADGAWLVRFLMSFFGWFAVLVAGGREFS